MSDIPSYSIEEAREILLDQVITLDAHIYLEGRCEEYVRAEDYERPQIIQSSFRYIWTKTHNDWDWDAEVPAEGADTEYYRQREAVCHWFRRNTRIRGGFKHLPADIEKTKWTAEEAFGNIYKSVILEWVESKTGFTPGHSDAFLAHYRRARSLLYRSLTAEQKRACERTANQWNETCVPHDVQAQNFNNKFASVCRAFTTMLMKDFGIFPFVFYIGVPGHNVPAGLYEVMRKEGLAAQTFRSFTNVGPVLRDMRSYVNMNIDAMYRAEGMKPPPVRSAEHLKAAEYEFLRADIEGERVYLFEDRLREGWEDNSSHLFYQLIQFCHSAVTSSKQTPPPWKALSEDPAKLIVPECLPPGAVRFGVSPEKTLRDHRNVFIKHWFRQVGYLEFHHRFVRGGVLAEPAGERWHGLAKYDTNFTQQWLTNERLPQGAVSTVTESSIARPLAMRYGSRGPQITFDDSPSQLAPVPPEAAGPGLPDPDDQLRSGLFRLQAGRPSWPSPRLVPDTIYARLQWADQILSETGGKAAETLLLGVKWLVRLPPVANYDYDIVYFRRQEGKARSWAVESLPAWLHWDVDRCHIDTQEEVNGLAAFLSARPWSFRHDGKTRFAGVQMLWIFALAAIMYVRACRHAEEVSAQPTPRWALSGSSEWQQRAKGYQFPLASDDLREVIYEFRCYMEDLALSFSITGLPPSLLYSEHRTREAYVYSLVGEVAELRSLFCAVRCMPREGSAHYPSLPMFSGRRLWQQPQLGIPRSAHKEQIDVDALLAAISNPALFLDDDGLSRAAEAGLSALLELAMVWTELDGMTAGLESLPAYIRASTLARPPSLDRLKSSLLIAAAAHESGLSPVIERYPIDSAQEHAAADSSVARGGTRANRQDSTPSLQRIHTDIGRRLDAHLDEVNADPLLSRIQGSVAYEKERERRWKANELHRRDQNAVNLAAHNTIHPRKPPQLPVTLPDLQDLHADLEYTATDATHYVNTATAPKRKRKRVAQTDPSRSFRTSEDRSKDVEPPQRKSAASGTKAASRPATQPGRQAQKQPRKDRSDSRSRSRPGIRLASIMEIPQEQESFDLDHLRGSDDESEISLPLTISRPKAALRAPPRMEARRVPQGFSQDGRDSGLRTGEGEVVVAELGPGNRDAGVMKTVCEQGTPALDRVPPRPRPRRKEPGLNSQPGVSTAF